MNNKCQKDLDDKMTNTKQADEKGLSNAGDDNPHRLTTDLGILKIKIKVVY